MRTTANPGARCLNYSFNHIAPERYDIIAHPRPL